MASLQQPPNLADGVPMEDWFGLMARQLLTGCRLLVAGEPHRLVEIEFYYHADIHPDPFAHRDPVQVHCGRWYFHRTGGGYRGGSFKGLDVSFGQGDTFGGILIRSMETPDGTLIDGPSLCVDHLLAQTKNASVAELDQQIGTRLAWDISSPLAIVATELEDREVHHSARVGLSLKRFQPQAKSGQTALAYIMRPYRYLTEPRHISKGKRQLVLALHREGMNPQEICQVTKSSQATVYRSISLFNEGKQEMSFDRFFRTELNTNDLCRFQGLWQVRIGNG